VKLLFDQNLSPRLVDRLVDLFPDSSHVSLLGLSKASDRVVWDHAGEHEFVIVSKDSDFSDLSVVRGYPPKVIWIRRGNCATREIELILRQNFEAASAFFENPSIGSLILL
jgi:predicted nuclease of predicted toxin-antitoxin system